VYEGSPQTTFNATALGLASNIDTVKAYISRTEWRRSGAMASIFKT
jgi:hypothetical protein